MPVDSDQPVAPTPLGDLPWRPLHPLTPVFKAGRIAIVTALFIVQQTATQTELLIMLAGLGLILVVAAIGGFFSWRAMGFRVDGEHLEMKQGVFQREHRRLSLHRIETIDIAQPLLARVVNLAEVRVQSASASDSELRLAYLPEKEAWALREQLRAQSRVAAPAPAPSEDAEELAEGEAPAAIVPSTRSLQAEGEDIFVVSTADVVWGYVVARLVLFVPGTIIALILGLFLVGPEAAVGFLPIIIAIVSGVYGTLRSAESMVNFTILDHPDGLFIHRGLLNKLTQRVSLGRVQSVGIQEPFFWRLFGRARLTVDIAGYRGRDGAAAEETSILVPIARRDDCLRVLARVLPGFEVDEVPTVAAPRSARWLEPVGAPYLSAGMNAQCAITKFGWLRKFAIITPHEKVQSWRLSAGPIQRRLGLATLHLDTAGSHLAFEAKFQDATVARKLLDQSRATTR